MPTVSTRPQLAALRATRGYTQADVAAALDIAREAVGTLERRDDPRLSTLVRYVEALGGRLELQARFDDRVEPLAYRATTPPVHAEKGRRSSRTA